MEYDVAIVGGGPGGSSAGSLLKKYIPDLKVLIVEREPFPRDHVGESLLPVCCEVINEMGCWDEIEAADFPVKIGATYRWGTTADLWDFEFLPSEVYEDAPRPAKFEGQRTRTAFQVDRSIYDQILLERAKKWGVEVREGAKVVEATTKGDRITGLRLDDDTSVTARYYIDASGHSGLLRRTLGVSANEPSSLRNIAFWDYWQDAEWAVSIGASGTRIQIMSLGWGWMWFIPIGPTRTSLGLVVPAEYYKSSGKTPKELYDMAIASEPRMGPLLKNAQRENNFATTKDWSFLAERTVGENWFLIGEAAGFADPILSAGVSLAHISGKEAAYTIIELDRGRYPSSWLRSQFDRRQRRRIGHHIRFADYWYTTNAQFTDLISFTSEIAQDAGLNLDGKSAWQWLGTGGFVDEDISGAGFGGYTLSAVKYFVNEFSDNAPGWNVAQYNVFTLKLGGAKKADLSAFYGGEIYRDDQALERNGKILPGNGVFGFLRGVLAQSNRIDHIVRAIEQRWCTQKTQMGKWEMYAFAIQALEAMCDDGWVKPSKADGVPIWDIKEIVNPRNIRKNTDNRQLDGVG